MLNNTSSKSKFKGLLFVAGILFLMAISSLPMPYGLDQAEPMGAYLNGRFPAKTPGSADGWRVVNAYPNLTFIDPINLIELPDQSGFFIGGKKGHIWEISKDRNTNEKKVVLDIQERVTVGGDAGLINFILHPEFMDPASPNKGYAYVIYRYHPDNRWDCSNGVDRLSRFTFDEAAGIFFPDSELVLLQQYSGACNHMGGAMFFDEDGLLYFTVGDGGGSAAQFDLVQKIDEALFGGIFRIDVDMDPNRSHPIRRQPSQTDDSGESQYRNFSQGYFIPDDNPWVDETGGTMEEFFALGLRSPHRADYDPIEKEIWIGDVGGGQREEVTRVKIGENHGWPYREGDIGGPQPDPDVIIGKETEPFYAYDRQEGDCIIGGFLYRGERWRSDLDGLYLFGDHGTRNVWTINPDNQEVRLLTNVPEAGPGNKNGISAFGTDADGNIFILKVYATNEDGGVIYQLEQEGPEVPNPPDRLSETGAFKDLENLTPADGLIPYRVNAPLWSDGAIKRRWVALPNDGTFDNSDEQVTFFKLADWQFPKGTVFIKHFELPIDQNDASKTTRLETRFFVLTEDGRAYGVTYRWNEEGTEAFLIENEESREVAIVTADGGTEVQTWTFPSRTQCMSCHNGNANFVLGLKTWQLNGDLTYPSSGITSNQLATWNHLGIFDEGFEEASIDEFPKAYGLDDTDASLEQKVLSYLDANCANCHRPSGVEAIFDARYTTPLSQKKLIKELGTGRNTADGALIVKPGNHQLSELWVRDQALGDLSMPPIGKSINDQAYLTVLEEWINGLDNNIGNGENCDFSTVYLSDLDWIGEAINGYNDAERDKTIEDNVLTLNGKQYLKGLGVHAFSSITYNLNAEYHLFTSDIGVDDETCGAGSVIFEVYGDGELLYQSELLTQEDDPVSIEVSVEGVEELVIEVTDGGNGDNTCDHANWANAILKICETPANNAPTAAFTASPDSGPAVLTVNFDAIGSSDPDGDELTFSWDFGDGQTGNGPTITHDYNNPGSYTATLTVSDGQLDHSVSKTITVLVPNQPPIAAFTATPEEGFLPLTVNFDAGTSSDPDQDELTYTWDYGDGQSGNGKTSSHVYTEGGVFTVTLTVSDGELQDSIGLQIIVNIPNRPPIAFFTATPESGPFPLEVIFDASGSTDPDGDDLTYIWDFGDRETGSGEVVSNQYILPGEYTVSLIVSDGEYNDTFSLVVTASIFNTPPVASFTATPDSGPATLDVTFDGSASEDPDGDVISYSWDYGDGSSGIGQTSSHRYTIAGTYTATLLVSDGELSHSISTIIMVDQPNQAPVASFIASPQMGDAPLIVSFDGSASQDPDGDQLTFSWDFGDGTSGIGEILEHEYAIAGNYTATLTVHDGALDNSTATEIMVRQPNRAPVAIISASPKSGPAPLKVTFDGSGSEDPDGDELTYNWGFGNGETASEATTSYEFDTPGSYTVTLTVNDGKLTNTANILILVEQRNREPVALINATPVNGTAPLQVTFDGSGSQDPDGDQLSYNWDFGDGRMASGASVGHEYITVGNYLATLTVSDGEFSHVASITISVRNLNNSPTAAFTATPDEGVAPLSVTFDASSSRDVDGNELTYNWNFGDGTNGRGVSTTHVYSDPGSYTARLTVNDGEASSSASQLIMVNQMSGLNCQSSSEVFLSDVPWTAIPENDFAAVQQDKSISQSTMTINGVGYEKGIGVHANSWVSYHLGGQFERFTAEIGIDDAACSPGPVVFEVYGDGIQLYRSDLLTRNLTAVPLDIPVTWVDELVLKVHNGELLRDTCDQANWANASLQFCQEGAIAPVFCEGASTNLAFGHQTRQSSTSETNGSWKAIDGDPVDAFIETEMEVDPWWELDLGIPSEISYVNIWNRSECCVAEETKCRLYVSNEPFTSDNRNEIEQQEGVQSFDLGLPLSVKHKVPIYTTGRYLRVQVAGEAKLSLAEVEVVGCEEEADRSTDIWVEGECGELGESWSLGQSSDASNDQFVTLPSQSFSSTDVLPSDNRLMSSFYFDMKEQDLYTCYLRTKGNPITANSYWIRLNEGGWIVVDNIPSGNHFNWTNIREAGIGGSPLFFNLEAGENRLDIAFREGQVQLDKLYLTKKRKSTIGFGPFEEECLTSVGTTSTRYSLQSTLKVELAPNPFTDAFYLSIEQPPEKLRRAIIQVYDLQGRIILENYDFPFNKKMMIRPTARLLPGVYFVRIRSGKYEGVYKMVKG